MFVHEDEFVIIWDYKLSLKSAAMQQLLDAGVKTIQIQVTWTELEPEPDVYFFEKLLEYVKTAENLGLKVILKILQGCPLWSPPNWFLKNRHGEYNFYFHENPVFGRNDFDINDFSHVGIHYQRQIPSYWNSEAMGKLHQFLAALCSAMSEVNNLFLCNTTGIGGEYYINGEFFFDDFALGSYRNFLADKYKDISLYNALHSTSYIDFNHITYNDKCCNMDIFEWYEATLVQRIFEECEILKGYNKTNEQLTFASYFRAKEPGFLSVIQTGQYDSVYRWEKIRKMAKLDKIAMVRSDLYNKTTCFTNFLENVIECRKYGFELWTGAEGPYNIVKNTYLALRCGQRGFLCGLSDTLNYYMKNISKINKDQLFNIKRSVSLWRRHYGIV